MSRLLLPLRAAAVAALLALQACSSVPERSQPPAAELPPTAPPATRPAPAGPAGPAPATASPAIDRARLANVPFAALPGWGADRAQEALAAFLRGCERLRAQAAWHQACARAATVEANAVAARAFFEEQFEAFALSNADGTAEGIITGYYEPILRGSRTRSDTFRHPVHQPPEDILAIELSEAHPDLQGRRLRGRLEGRRVLPYHTRADIEAGKAPLHGREIVWIDDPVELFFLHVQGSGRVRLEEGGSIRVSYADHNGHPYVSIGRLLVERGELSLDQASMQAIRAWGERNPAKLPALLRENPSYVFFRELPADGNGPPGSLGVPLTAGRSLAVDPRAVPLGAPVWLSTTEPNTTTPLNRLMVAQDTGGAIKGGVRGDFYWGSGDAAGVQAGRMRQSGRMWVLLPRGFMADPPAR